MTPFITALLPFARKAAVPLAVFLSGAALGGFCSGAVHNMNTRAELRSVAQKLTAMEAETAKLLAAQREQIQRQDKVARQLLEDVDSRLMSFNEARNAQLQDQISSAVRRAEARARLRQDTADVGGGDTADTVSDDFLRDYLAGFSALPH